MVTALGALRSMRSLQAKANSGSVAWGLSRTTSRKAAYSAAGITGGRPVFAIALLLCSWYDEMIIYFFYTLLGPAMQLLAIAGS